MIYNKIVFKGNKHPWLILLHGMGGSSKIWYKQIDFFQKDFNLILPDYYGHGDTNEIRKKYSFEDIADSIIDVLDHHNIQKVNIAGISLGSIIACTIINMYPNRVNTAVLAGSVMKFDIKTKVLLYLGKALKNFLPYMLIYRFFALVVMPMPNHSKSRNIFINEAIKLGDKEFLKWYDLMLTFPWKSRQIQNKLLKTDVKKLFISGKEDHLFLQSVIDYSKKDKNSCLKIIKNCGHVCNIEKPEAFNELSYDFYQSHLS